MSVCKLEQRVNIKFFVKRNNSATKTFQLLTEAYREDCMYRARMLEWHKQFLEGRESVKDDERPGRPLSLITDNNIENVRDLIRKDRRLGVRTIAEIVIDRETVRSILTEELNIKCLCKDGF
jgi:hypothetical protein